MIKTCPSCGKTAPASARYCPGCGHSVETADERRVRQRKTRRTAIIVIALLAAGLLLAGCLVWRMFAGLFGPVREPVDAWLDHLRDGRITEAWRETASAFRQRVPEPSFAAWLDRRPSLKDADKRSFSNYRITGKTARLGGTLTTRTGMVTPVVFVLVHENGQWRILAVRLKASGNHRPRRDEPPDRQAAITGRQDAIAGQNLQYRRHA